MPSGRLVAIRLELAIIEQTKYQPIFDNSAEACRSIAP
jgi:hypothetical protein